MASASDHIVEGPGKLPGPGATSSQHVPTRKRKPGGQARKRRDRRKADRATTTTGRDRQPANGVATSPEDEHQVDYLA